MARKTNPEIIAEFAELLTTGAREAFNDLGRQEELLEGTKEWRSALWKQLKQVEERMCPKPPERLPVDGSQSQQPEG